MQRITPPRARAQCTKMLIRRARSARRCSCSRSVCFQPAGRRPPGDSQSRPPRWRPVARHRGHRYASCDQEGADVVADAAAVGQRSTINDAEAQRHTSKYMMCSQKDSRVVQKLSRVYGDSGDDGLGMRTTVFLAAAHDISSGRHSRGNASGKWSLRSNTSWGDSYRPWNVAARRKSQRSTRKRCKATLNL
ncbi:hypothetical protein PYCCODRAFT_1192165 [Trametes coccinea BRFM310]|uniref:Uncharacterized protein n=1 Tax=Trametes coccinea (strain BRFM310) TaxID=1353009 RepID=A0A1Y2I7P8_TRAC3|nr:hypothetical protein PYCCODRAFT_1192165 [Trametes coccinea BRFM310]